MSIYHNANGILIRGIGFILVIIVSSACQSLVPATTPPQLEHTAGAPIIITDTRIETDWFSIVYPVGWRVVTGVAIEPISLLLIAPDDAYIIRVADARAGCPASPTPDAHRHQRATCLGEDNRQVFISGDTAPTTLTTYNAYFDAVVASVRFIPDNSDS